MGKHVKNPEKVEKKSVAYRVVKFFTIFLAVVLAVLLIGGGAVAIGVYRLLHNMQEGPTTTLDYEAQQSLIAAMEAEDQASAEELEGLEVVEEHELEEHPGVTMVQHEVEKGVYNFLLLGLDTRDDEYLENSRTDVNIIVTLDTEKGIIRLTSLMRDILLPIEGYGQNRINTINRFKGADALVETVEKYTGIPILGYMKVNFSCVASVVNILGGVDVELTAAEVKHVNKNLTEHNQRDSKNPTEEYLSDPEGDGGHYHLGGKQAVAYMRIRKLSGGEFGRTARQRKVLTQVMQDMKEIEMTEALELITEISNYMATDMSKTDLVKYAMMVYNLRGADVVELNIPANGTFTGISYKGMSVWKIDFDANAEIIQNFIYGDGSLAAAAENK